MKLAIKQFFTFLCIIFLSTSLVAQGTTGSTTGSTEDKTDKKKTTTKDGSTSDDGVSKAGWLSHSAAGYSIKYPSDWELNTSGQMYTTFVLFSPLESDYDAFKENINLMVQNLATYGLSGTTLEQYIELSLTQMPNYVSNFYLVSSKKKTQNGRTYQEVVYTGTQTGYNLKWKQQVWLEGDKAYILTFTAEETKYNDYVKQCTSMMNTCQKK